MAAGWKRLVAALLLTESIVQPVGSGWLGDFSSRVSRNCSDLPREGQALMTQHIVDSRRRPRYVAHTIRLRRKLFW